MAGCGSTGATGSSADAASYTAEGSVIGGGETGSFDGVFEVQDGSAATAAASTKLGIGLRWLAALAVGQNGHEPAETLAGFTNVSQVGHRTNDAIAETLP
jgi:hypothetical protein